MYLFIYLIVSGHSCDKQDLALWPVDFSLVVA